MRPTPLDCKAGGPLIGNPIPADALACRDERAEAALYFITRSLGKSDRTWGPDSVTKTVSE